MPDATLNGKATKPIPGSVKSAMAKGYPKSTAQALPGAKKPTSTVKV
jgi:hypothetical protein